MHSYTQPAGQANAVHSYACKCRQQRACMHLAGTLIPHAAVQPLLTHDDAEERHEAEELQANEQHPREDLQRQGRQRGQFWQRRQGCMNAASSSTRACMCGMAEAEVPGLRRNAPPGV